MTAGPTTSTTPPAAVVPWFAVTMTVRNNAGTIEESLRAILPQLEDGGELVVVDALSVDGTREILDALARSDPRVTVIEKRCNRGVGRNLAVRAARAPIVLTQVDGDNRYAPAVLRNVAAYLRSHPRTGLLFTVGLSDRDPSLTRFFAWRRDAFELAGGYPDTQEREDPPLLLRAFRAGLVTERILLPRIADDLKARPVRYAPNVAPWRRGRHTMWAARKFRLMGFRFPEYARLLWLTHRTLPRFGAGLAIGGVAYLQGAVLRDGREFLEQDDKDQIPAAAEGSVSGGMPPPPTDGSNLR
ncbi:MAG: glycosyltransferase [Thermoplasmata archaeon]|nr:glycosyltransferase [Thermoplasmata archaeon]